MTLKFSSGKRVFVERRNKWLTIMVLIAGIGFTIPSCSKKDADIQPTHSKLFIRIAQVEKDGSVHYSKITEVVKN